MGHLRSRRQPSLSSPWAVDAEQAAAPESRAVAEPPPAPAPPSQAVQFPGTPPRIPPICQSQQADAADGGGPARPGCFPDQERLLLQVQERIAENEKLQTRLREETQRLHAETINNFRFQDGVLSDERQMRRILEDHVRTTRSLVRYLLDQLVTVHQQMLLEREAAQHRADMAQKREDDRRREADEMRRKSEEDRLAVGRLREELAELRRELAARHAESAAAAAREAEQARAQIALVKGQVDHAGAQLGRGIQTLSARIDGGDRQLRQVVAAQNAGAEQAAGALKAVLAEAIAAARKEGEDGQAPLRPLITRALDEARSEHLCAVADLEKRCAAAVKANDARCDAAAEACRTLEARVAAISSAQAGLSERLEITSAKNEKTAEDILAAIGSTKEALQLVRSEAALKRSALKGEMRAELASLRETSDSLLDELRGDVRRLQRPIVVV